MELVIDTNCIISALIKNGKSRELICSIYLSLYAPEDIISETYAHKKEIIDKSGISDDDFNLLTNIILLNIKIIPLDEFQNFQNNAMKLAKHPEDSPFIALALSKNLPIWSDDKGIKEQSEVKVFSTTELINLFWK